DHKQRHEGAASQPLHVHHQAVRDLGQALHGLIDFTGAHPHARPVDGGIGTAVDDAAAVGCDLDPVAVAPYAWVGGEIAVAVALAVGVVPEKQGHGRHGPGHHQFAHLVNDGPPRFVVGFH